MSAFHRRSLAVSTICLLVFSSNCTFSGESPPVTEVAPTAAIEESSITELTARAGSGFGPFADESSLDMGPMVMDSGTANHVVIAETATGAIHLVVGLQANQNCALVVDRIGGSAACNDASWESLGDGSGWTADGTWSTNYFYGPEGSTRLIATTKAGTRYESSVFARWGLMVWPTIEGMVIDVAFYDDVGEFVGSITPPS